MIYSNDDPDFDALEGVISTRILNAARAASEAMTRAGVRHALIGGLAVGAYGYVRATKDVDFLVGDEGFEHHGAGIVTLKVPIEVNGVPVDSLTETAVEDELDAPVESEGVPFVSVEALFLLKLKSYRRRDKEDVVELLKAGVDESPIRQYLRDRAPELLGRFEALIRRADED